MARPAPWSFRSLFTHVAPVVSLLTFGGGLFVLLGWVLDLEVLKRILPGLVSMNPLTAVTFMLAGAALWLLAAGRRPMVAQVLSLLVLISGLTRLLGCALDWAGGPDLWLFAGKLEHDTLSHSNRMSPNSALNFVLVGCALLLMEKVTRRGRRPAEVFALAVGFISLLALIGYAYEVSWLYEVVTFIPMALHTATLFLLLSVGLLCARREAGVMALVTGESPGGAMIRRVLPVLIPALVLLGWLRLAGERRGYYEAELGTALYTITTITVLTGLVWWSARSLQQTDRERIRLEMEMQRFFTLPLDIFCIAGTDGYFKRANPTFCQTLGYTEAELLARPFVEFIHPEDRDRTVVEASEIFGGKPEDHFENRYVRKDGSVRWFWWKARHVESEGILYATARDVTEQKLAQAKVEQLNGELEDRAAQLNATNQELEAFSYSVSHDLRAPLRGIAGFAQALEEHAKGSLDTTGHNYLNRVRKAADRMGWLIDDLLKLSRLTRAEMRLETVDLSAQAESILKLLQQREPDRSVTWEIAPNLTVHGDAALLRVLMENLLENAWKFTARQPEGRIEVGQTVTAGSSACFVQDNGVGFDMRYAGKLFGAFQRLHSMVEFPGTGIGLATVQRVVRRHGGRVWAHAEVDKGAAFYFTL